MVKQLMLDFERSAAPTPGDERILLHATNLALVETRSSRGLRIRMVGAAAVIVLIAGVASAAILLHRRHRADGEAPTGLAQPLRHEARAVAATAAPMAEPPPPTEVPIATAMRTHAAPPTMKTADRTPRPSVLPRSRKPVGPAVREDRVENPVEDQLNAPPPSSFADAPPPVESAADLFARALAQREQGRTASAITTFRTLQRRFPGSPQAVLSWVSLADLLLASGDAVAALSAFEAYLTAAPLGILVPEALLGKAHALEVLGRARQAERVRRELERRYLDAH